MKCIQTNKWVCDMCGYITPMMPSCFPTCPACEIKPTTYSANTECECDHNGKPMTYWGVKVKPKEQNESLEENKYEQAWKSEGDYWHIFKQGTPFAGDDFVNEFNKMKKEREGMVSIDEVLSLDFKGIAYSEIWSEFNVTSGRLTTDKTDQLCLTMSQLIEDKLRKVISNIGEKK